jgi:hypothetical protein
MPHICNTNPTDIIKCTHSGQVNIKGDNFICTACGKPLIGWLQVSQLQNIRKVFQVLLHEREKEFFEGMEYIQVDR